MNRVTEYFGRIVVSAQHSSGNGIFALPFSNEPKFFKQKKEFVNQWDEFFGFITWLTNHVNQSNWMPKILEMKLLLREQRLRAFQEADLTGTTRFWVNDYLHYINTSIKDGKGSPNPLSCHRRLFLSSSSSSSESPLSLNRGFFSCRKIQTEDVLLKLQRKMFHYK